ncbi:hypothetical protein ACRU44_00940 [Mycobacterium colombiense]
MTDGGSDPRFIRDMVGTAWSADLASADPDDPVVRGFADFGLPAHSPLATADHIRELDAWRDSLQIAANSAFVDGTMLLTVDALLGSRPNLLTPVTLWELTAFIDAVVSFDRLYCVANPVIDVAFFNQKLGAEVLTAIADPDGGMLRLLAAQSAANGVLEMRSLRAHAGSPDAFGQEVQAVADSWRAVLGPDFPTDGPFNVDPVDTRLARMTAPNHSAGLIDGVIASTPVNWLLNVLISSTALPQTPAQRTDPVTLRDRQEFAATCTYRTYVNQGIANALGLPYLPGTLRMPFRRLFVQRAAQVQDELISVALADRVFAQQQPASPLILPFFTAAVLQQAATREDVWAQMARVRDQSAVFRRKRAELDRMLERSQVSPEALRIQNAIHDEALKMADVTGVAQQTASVALGVFAQTGIVPLAGALKTGVDAARGVGRSGSWTRIWRRLFHRHEYFLARTNSQAIALTNALPQVQQLWEMPKVGGYLDRFATATQQIGHILRD